MAVYDLSITDGLLSTTRAVRKRLDFERPVSNDIIRACLELALQAPTGANRQGWRWIVITDRDKRNAMGEIYRRGAGTYLEDGQRNADTTGAAQDSRVFSSAQYLAANIQKAPVHVIPCIAVDQLPVDPPRHVWPGLMGSILPAVWSFQLALRARGLGSTFTTVKRHPEWPPSRHQKLPPLVVMLVRFRRALTQWSSAEDHCGVLHADGSYHHGW